LYYITKKYISTFVLGGKYKVEFEFIVCRVHSLLIWVSAGLEIRYRIQNKCWSPNRIREFYLRCSVWAHHVSYYMGNDGYFPGL